MQRLRTIPGIGPFTAILLILDLGELQRFPSAKHLASYVGLTSRVRASANRVRMGRISKEGNRLLRWALVAATQAARRPGPLTSLVPDRTTPQGHEKIASVALARRLAKMVHQIWKPDIDFVTLVRGGVRG